jgi:anti-sigma factor RsiW
MKEHRIVQELLTLAAADMLDAAEERRVQQHLLHCDECRTEYGKWTWITGALEALPIPQASQGLVIRTQRLLYSTATAKQHQASKAGMALLVVFSWMVAFMTLSFVRMLGVPLTRWLDVSSTTLWIAYIGTSWFATALAAGILGKRYQQEGRTI